MLPRSAIHSKMRILLSLVVMVCAVEAAKKFEGTLRSAAEAPPQDNLAVETAPAEPTIVAAPQEYKNPGAPPPVKSAPEETPEEAPEEAPAADPVPETASGGIPPSAPSGISAPSAPANSLEECDPEMIGFELVTGYVFSAPSHILDDIPGTLMLTDCLEQCQANDTCRAVNYETGLCVLFSSDADQLPGALTKSQFPVFTIYAQKSCLGVRPCERAWCFDRVRGYHLKGKGKKTHTVGSRQMCLDLCLGENEFVCSGEDAPKHADSNPDMDVSHQDACLRQFLDFLENVLARNRHLIRGQLKSLYRFRYDDKYNFAGIR